MKRGVNDYRELRNICFRIEKMKIVDERILSEKSLWGGLGLDGMKG